MADYQKKTIIGQALDVDPKTRQVKIGISEMESVDRDNDVFDKSAWDKTIAERGPKGSQEVWHLLDHNKSFFYALSKFNELNTESIKGKPYLTGVSAYRDTFAWKEVAWPLYEAGDINQHSVGFRAVQKMPAPDKSHNIIKQAELWEGSAVLWGANPNTPTFQVMKSAGMMEPDREEQELYLDSLNRLIKRIREDKYHEDNKALLIIEILRFKNKFEEIVAKQPTEPVLKTTQPDATDQRTAIEIVQKLSALEQLFKS